MQNTKHTPGTWKTNTSSVSTQFVVGENREMIFEVIHYEKTVIERQANDRLIAAAPELLEALETLFKAVMKSSDRDILYGENNAGLQPLVLNTIAKAKGGQK